MRTFISINIDDSTKEKIFEIQDELKNKLSAINEKILKVITWTSKENFHLTLFFIGEINENKLKEIDNCLLNLQSEISLNEIKFKLKSINSFPKLRHPRVLIMELLNEDKKVSELSDKLNESLKQIGLVNDKRFYPHITLGRIKRQHKINLTGLEETLIPDLNFSVNEFQLMESKLGSSGAKYEIIKNYKL